MKKILIAFLLITITTFCGCSKTPEFNPPENDIVEYPNKISKSTVNGYKGNFKEETSSDSVYYYFCNRKSKKFHTNDCRYARQIDEVELWLESDYEVILSSGYVACKVCEPKYNSR